MHAYAHTRAEAGRGAGEMGADPAVGSGGASQCSKACDPSASFVCALRVRPCAYRTSFVCPCAYRTGHAE